MTREARSLGMTGGRTGHYHSLVTRMRRGSATRLLLAVALVSAAALHAQGAPPPDPRYRTRTSDCRVEPPPGRALTPTSRDGSVRITGYTAEKVVTHTADARGLAGGEIIVCTEYGRVEIADADDQSVHVQVRLEGFGEGSPDPAEAARRVIEETDIRVAMSAHEGRLNVRVWHATLGFTPMAQAAAVGIRVLVPASGAYAVQSTAFHGAVAVRRLTLARSTFRGRVGDKFKGIPGYIGPMELDNVTLAGDVDVTSDGARLAAPVFAKLRVASSSRLSVETGGDITIAVQPHPSLGVHALAETSADTARVQIDGATSSDAPGGTLAVRRQAESLGFSDKSVKLDVRVTSTAGRVTIVSMPAAPLAPSR